MKRLKVNISVSFLVLAAIIVLSGFNEIAICTMIASLLHEFGHLAAVVGLGGQVLGVRLKAFAAEIIIDERSFSYKGEALISFFGPLMNLVTAMMSLMLFGLSHFFICSLVLGIFHLLPVIGLDGGNMLIALIADSRRELCWNKCLSIVSLIISIMLLVLGAYVLSITKFNISVLAMTLILIFEIIRKKDSGFLKTKKSA